MTKNVLPIPILYSLQNCPYAIRARYSLFKANQTVLIRAIKLNNKPAEMLRLSPKGSVPILVLNPHDIADTSHVIDESIDIMLWALNKNDPQGLLNCNSSDVQAEMISFIQNFDATFIPALEAYCCAKRYHEKNVDECRYQCELTLQSLEIKLSEHAFLYSEKESLIDIALLPFIRKFARVDRQWYRNSPYPKLQKWLTNYLQSSLFTKVMASHELWLENRKDIYLGN